MDPTEIIDLLTDARGAAMLARFSVGHETGSATRERCDCTVCIALRTAIDALAEAIKEAPGLATFDADGPDHQAKTERRQ